MTAIAITQENAGRRLDKFLFAYLNNAPHSFIYKMLRKKRIKLNGARAAGNELLQPGDELQFFISGETLEGCKKARVFAPARELTGIIYEDENILVVNKPMGLPSQGGGKKIQPVKQFDQLISRILFYLQETGAYNAENADFTPALCNRLDVNTSGLVICGKNLPALREINALFANREVKKEYLAIVHGVAGEITESRRLENFCEKDEKANKARILQGLTGAKIITDYTVLAVSKNEKFSLLSVSPVTGRSHQIRVHLSHIGHPLLGDKKYGGRPSTSAPAQLLHCARLELPKMKFEAPPPENFIAKIRDIFTHFPQNMI